MKSILSFFLLTAALTVMGCGAKADDESEDNDTVGAEIAEDYNRQMDKAREVETQLLESKQNIDDALENAEGAVEEDDDGVKN